MRPLGFLVSVLLHAVFLLLLLHARFPMGDVPAEMQVIEIVPMAPPVAATRRPGPPPAPPLVFVRPFVLKGGAPGAANGSAAGKREAHAAAASASGYQRSIGGNGSLPATAPVAKEGDAARQLTVDMKRIESKLTGEGSPGATGIAGAGALAATGKGVPFGDPGGNGRGGRHGQPCPSGAMLSSIRAAMTLLPGPNAWSTASRKTRSSRRLPDTA